MDALSDRPAFDVIVVVDGYAATAYQRAGVHRLSDVVDPAAPEAAGDLVRKLAPDLVVVGKSWAARLPEDRIVAAASAAEIPSLLVADHWVNLDWVVRSANGDARAFPGAVAVPGDAAREVLLREGAPADRVRVTGSPHFDGVVERIHAASAKRDEIRRRLGATASAPLVAFASEPVARQESLLGSDAMARFGYTESTILLDVLAACSELAERGGREVQVFVKPHPKEDPAALQAVRREWPGVRVLGPRPPIQPAELIAASDLVIGITSMMLVEAALAGREVLSVQTGLISTDPNPLTAARLLPVVYDRTKLADAIAGSLEAAAGPRRGAAPARLSPPGSATARVVAVCEELLDARRSVGP